MSEPRRHHYLPQFYLAGFTKTGDKDGRLFVLDRRQRKQWPAKPKDAGLQRDYYAIETDDVSRRNDLERALGNIESVMAPVVDRIAFTKQLPTDPAEFNVFLNFVALMAIRVPHVRNTLDDFTDRLMKSVMWYWFNDPRAKAGLAANFRERGEELTDEVYQGMKELYDSGTLTVTMDQNTTLGMTFDMAKTLLPLLAERKWALHIAADDAPDFVTSDLPVILSWTDGAAGPDPPAFGTMNTMLTFPLTRRVMAVSNFEGLAGIDALPTKFVAALNAMTLTYGQQIYSSEAEFTWQQPDGGIALGSDFVRWLKQQSDNSPQVAP